MADILLRGGGHVKVVSTMDLFKYLNNTYSLHVMAQAEVRAGYLWFR